MDPLWDGNKQRPSQGVFDAVLEGPSTPAITSYDWKTIFCVYPSPRMPVSHHKDDITFLSRESLQTYRPSFVTVTRSGVDPNCL